MKNNLKKIREHSTSYTQRDMAEKLGVSVSAYSKWEQGQRDIDAPNLVKLVRILNVSADSIIGTDYSQVERDCDTTNRLSESEQCLLDDYRQLDEADQATVTRVVYALLYTAEHGDM